MSKIVSHSAFKMAAEKRDAEKEKQSLSDSFNSLDERLLETVSGLNLAQIISSCLERWPMATAMHTW